MLKLLLLELNLNERLLMIPFQNISGQVWLNDPFIELEQLPHHEISFSSIVQKQSANKIDSVLNWNVNGV